MVRKNAGAINHIAKIVPVRLHHHHRQKMPVRTQTVFNKISCFVPDRFRKYFPAQTLHKKFPLTRDHFQKYFPEPGKISQLEKYIPAIASGTVNNFPAQKNFPLKLSRHRRSNTFTQHSEKPLSRPGSGQDSWYPPEMTERDRLMTLYCPRLPKQA